MRAMVLYEVGGRLELEDRPEPRLRGSEVLVKVHGAGLCGSDLHMIDGRMPHLPLPRVLGHEISGEAAGIGEVIVYASWGDGTCDFCRAGEEQLCARAAEPGWARDGGFAEAVVVPSPAYLLPLQGLDSVRAAPLADAGVTAYRAVRRARPWLGYGSTAIVIGAGGLGQFAIQYLRLLTDASVLVVEPTAAKQARALELGAGSAVGTDDVDLPLAAVVFDFVGSAKTLRRAAGLVRTNGLVVLVGEAGGQLPFGISTMASEASLTTSIWGSRAELATVVDLAQGGQISWEVEVLPLSEANTVVDRLRRGDVRGRFVLSPIESFRA